MKRENQKSLHTFNYAIETTSQIEPAHCRVSTFIRFKIINLSHIIFITSMDCGLFIKHKLWQDQYI